MWKMAVKTGERDSFITLFCSLLEKLRQNFTYIAESRTEFSRRHFKLFLTLSQLYINQQPTIIPAPTTTNVLRKIFW